ncbi:hypothetical protein F8M41_023160 [Gigaspora margarita]|uniref:Uncharacterized protein n=1 Tax=Gigaspora margarita TaxID=4874 RepID=A0A8H4EHI1_GIGMA|nr:hypothetical protein F8M41_023160 [Gigaspora margarita]
MNKNSQSKSKPSINSNSTDPFEYNYNFSLPDMNQIVEQDLKQELSTSLIFRKNITNNQNLLDISESTTSSISSSHNSNLVDKISKEAKSLPGTENNIPIAVFCPMTTLPIELPEFLETVNIFDDSSNSNSESTNSGEDNYKDKDKSADRYCIISLEVG